MNLEGLKILVCLPGDNFSGKFLQSLTALVWFFAQKKVVFALNYVVCPIVHTARERCLTNVDYSKFDYVLWIDSDIVFESKHLEQLLSAEKNIIGALYKRLRNNGENIETINVCGYINKEDNRLIPLVESDSEEDIVPVDYTGFGFLLMKSEAITKLPGNPFMPTNEFEYNNGEDTTFCLRLKEIGETIFVNKSVKVLHEKTVTI